ncbi:hypothetical protein ACWCQL_38085 [Streptomyces sp. NPDC002073]
MGYDLYIESAPDDAERAAIAKADEALKEARKTGGDVGAAYEALDAANLSYFRFGVGSMGAACHLMTGLGMLSLEEEPEWPAINEKGFSEALEALRTDPEDAAARKTVQAAMDRVEGVHEAIRTADPGGPGIADYKLMSNDGWLVTPREITAALKAYENAPPADREAAARELGPHWTSWIAFLTRGRDRGGFRVH